MATSRIVSSYSVSEQMEGAGEALMQPDAFKTNTCDPAGLPEDSIIYPEAINVGVEPSMASPKSHFEFLTRRTRPKNRVVLSDVRKTARVLEKLRRIPECRYLKVCPRSEDYSGEQDVV